MVAIDAFVFLYKSFLWKMIGKIVLSQNVGDYMQNENIILITKDALNILYLPVYGNKFWATPNMDELSKKGTLFMKYYTGAPSTCMSNMCMFTGLFSYQSGMSDYILSRLRFQGKSLFDKFNDLGYETDIIWDEAWKTSFKMEERYYCYGEKTKIHYLAGFRQGVGAHYKHNGFFEPNPAKTERVYQMINEKLSKILNQGEGKHFIWLHVPHVINGRTGYGQDIDAFDQIVGLARGLFSDDNIFISADHGNMNGAKGKLSYGHDVYEPNVRIPLITPKIQSVSVCNELCCNVDLDKILIDRIIPKRNLIYSDSAFYAQPNRKIACITRNYKYIYNKKSGAEELYDLRTDPCEECNLISDYVYDDDRHISSPLRELYFYPYWSEAEEARKILREEIKKVWKNGTFVEELKPIYREVRAKIASKLKK